MNKDQIEGRAGKVKGTVKEVAGKVTGKDSLKLKGKLQKAVGKVQAAYGDFKDDVEKAE